MTVIYNVTWILSFLLLIYFFVCAACEIFVKISLLHRRRKTDARIIAQAKAIGVWDKKPIVLGGRALEIKAWEDFKIKREPGEPDANLRRRYMKAEANNKADGYTVEVILCDENHKTGDTK